MGRPRKNPTTQTQGEKPEKKPEKIKPIEEYFKKTEAAEYFLVNEKTIDLWLLHGLLKSVERDGIKMIPLSSMIDCRFRNRAFSKLPEKELLRVDEVANYWSISVKTIYSWIESGKLKAVTIGDSKLLRIERETVLKMKKPIE